jgi:hypothetical protein
MLKGMPRRRLIIRPGAIGDFIVSLPALEHLGGEFVELWAASQNLPLARFANRARSIASTGLDLLGIGEPDPALVAELRGFDAIDSWYGANRPEFRELTASLDLPFRFFPALPPEGAGMHAVDFYLRQVGAPSGAAPRIECPVQRGDFAAIHPFSGSPKKSWPLENYRELARRLERHMPVRWCAGPHDELPGAVRIPDLYHLACWLAGARVYIGNDSGISHLAAAAGASVVALFGPTDPAVWAPRGPRVRILAAAGLRITVDEVERQALC